MLVREQVASGSEFSVVLQSLCASSHLADPRRRKNMLMGCFSKARGSFELFYLCVDGRVGT